MIKTHKYLAFFLLILGTTIGWVGNKYYEGFHKEVQDIIPSSVKSSKPLEKYTIEHLSKSTIKSGKLEIEDQLKEEKEFTSNIFEFEFNPNLDGKTIKKTTGQLNVPKDKKTYPAIIMLRGYIDQETYRTGDGTRNAAAYFAKNGFITVAPDFLGYGGSDQEADNIFESRFQTYLTVVSLIESFEQISNWDRTNLFIWGHSNGGQIALTVLEITGGEYPTTLWAPVSKPFPYSVLYYTDASEDRGKLIRKELAKFEEDYEPDLFSVDLYLDRIQVPLQIQQGTDDDAVPKDWSDSLVSKLKKIEKEVVYHIYPGTDHNMRPSWDTVIERDLEFFKKHLTR